MKFNIIAKPKAKKEYVRRIETTNYIVSVKEPPINNKANNAIIKALAKYFNKSISEIFILTGETSKQKVIEILITKSELEKIEDDKILQKKLI